MKQITKDDWYFIWLVIVIIADVSANELGYGAITFAPLTILACWLMTKVFKKEKPND